MPIYLDHHATTPVHPEALEAMLPYFSEHYGNAMSGNHAFGWKAQNALTQARRQIADLIGAENAEIIFTSGATESVHLAILGLLEERGTPSHIISAPTEHKCVIEVCKRAEKQGHEVTWLPVNQFGQIDLEDIKSAIRPGKTALITLMHGNNEVGTLHPIEQIGEIAKANGILFHVDAAQTFTRVPINVRKFNIDLLSISAHKFYGPKGVGALFVRQTTPRLHLSPYLVGGGQEKGLRGGTQNVPGIVGMGKAAEVSSHAMSDEVARLTKLRDHMIARLTERPSDVTLNGHPNLRLCNNVNVTVSAVSTDAILLALHDVAFSSASACSSGSGETSHVLSAMNRLEARDSTTVRFGLGRSTSLAEIDEVCDRLLAVIANARKNSRG